MVIIRKIDMPCDIEYWLVVLGQGFKGAIQAQLFPLPERVYREVPGQATYQLHQSGPLAGGRLVVSETPQQGNPNLPPVVAVNMPTGAENTTGSALKDVSGAI